MKMLLTHDQESTMWHLTETIASPEEGQYYFSPYYMKPLGNGEYERLTYDQLPESIKVAVLAQKALKESA